MQPFGPFYGVGVCPSGNTHSNDSSVKPAVPAEARSSVHCDLGDFPIDLEADDFIKPETTKPLDSTMPADAGAVGPRRFPVELSCTVSEISSSGVVCSNPRRALDPVCISCGVDLSVLDKTSKGSPSTSCAYVSTVRANVSAGDCYENDFCLDISRPEAAELLQMMSTSKCCQN